MVREIPVGSGYVALVDDEDFDYLSQFSWGAYIDNATIYAKRRITASTRRRVAIAMHREVLSAPDGIDVDHVDGNGLNNTRANLRLATRQENSRNCRIRRSNTSGFKGVHWHKPRGTWAASIRTGNKKKRIGYYRSKEDAARAYDAKAREVHGAFACLNFPLPGERSAR